jgi:hypothetical protein
MGTGSSLEGGEYFKPGTRPIPIGRLGISDAVEKPPLPLKCGRIRLEREV